MTRTRVLLIRHGETTDPNRFHGAESDVALGERGLRQAEAAARALAAEGPAAVYSSAMRRAIQTAEPIAAACGVALQVEPRLHERRMGSLSGMTRDQGHAEYALAKSHWTRGEIDYTHAGGESYRDIRERVLPVFQEIADRCSGQTVVIVAHGVVIRVILTSILEGTGPARFETFPIDNVALNDLLLARGRWTAACLNRPLADQVERYAW